MLTLKLTLDGGNRFYKRIESKLTDDNRLIVYDVVNFSVYIFKQYGKLIKTFSKKGNKNGELSEDMRIFTAKSKYMVMERWDAIYLFNYNGDSLTTIKSLR